MSMHKIPLTQIEEDGLRAHGLDIGVPSQLSDAFRHGVAWALTAGQGEAVAPYGYLREVDGQVQLSVGPARPADRSGGCATPWAAIFAAPSAQQKESGDE